MGRIITFIFLTLLFFSCDDNNNDYIDNNADILPLSVGNSWTYSVTTYDEYDNILDEVEQTAQITNSIEINNKIYYKLSWSGFMYDGLYLHNDNGGLWHHGTDFFMLDSPELLFSKLDYDSLGYYISYSNEIRMTGSYTRTIYIDDNEYETYFYNSYPNEYEYRNWFILPGTGAMRIEMHHYWHLRAKYELISFNIQ